MSQYFVAGEKENEMRVRIRVEVMACELEWEGSLQEIEVWLYLLPCVQNLL